MRSARLEFAFVEDTLVGRVTPCAPTEFRLPYITDLVARKLAGPEKSKLEDADITFHESEYQRLRGELQAAHDASPLPEAPSEETRTALNDLLVRIRLKFRVTRAKR
jgi:predicted nucleotidyltransferase